ncbi:MAG: hypothetical protein GX303_02955 [Clostridiales bacterium]|nr:hypothetical protein [Clostridiales bacterium]
MSYIKLFGAATILLVSLYLSSQITTFAQRRMRQTEAFLILLRYIKAQVACYKTPVAEIYQSFNNRTLEECGFVNVLREKGFEAALYECESMLYIDQNEFELLYAFASELGRGFQEEQLNSCDYHIGALEELYAKQKNEMPKKCKIYRTLIFTIGIMIIIILI